MVTDNMVGKIKWPRPSNSDVKEVFIILQVFSRQIRKTLDASSHIVSTIMGGFTALAVARLLIFLSLSQKLEAIRQSVSMPIVFQIISPISAFRKSPKTWHRKFPAFWQWCRRFPTVANFWNLEILCRWFLVCRWGLWNNPTAVL